jgi:RNA polymerase sigma factor (sigma-70 family)
VTASPAFDAIADARFDALLERSSLGASGARQLRGRTPLAAAETIRHMSAPEGFEEFYRASYPKVVKAAMFAGATFEEAEDAASRTFLEMLEKWPANGAPIGYARTAVVHHFIRDKTRRYRAAQRLIDCGHVPRHEGYKDDRLTAWEDSQWVAEVLSALPQAQQEVMECIARGLDRKEIAQHLGKSEAAVRRNLHDARARLAEFLRPDGEPRQPLGLLFNL